MSDLVPGTVYSLSEIEAHAKKAVRGAGFAWGYAEEAGKAVRLLAAHQLPGAIVLAAYLTERAADSGFSGPVVSGEAWSAVEPTQALCPVLSGAVFCDHARAVVKEGSHVLLTELAYPLLVLPYMALLSRRLDCSLQISWDGVELTLHQGRLTLLANEGDALQTGRAERFSCRSITVEDAGQEAGNSGQVISDEIWLALNEFAYRTYVPATEASRRGAGPAD